MSEDDARTQATDLERAFWTAGIWLLETHHDACEAALDAGFFVGLPPAMRARVDEVPDQVRRFVEVNAMEWLVAEARLVLDGRKVRAAKLVLGPGGPPLSRAQRACILAMASEPIRFYTVIDVITDESLRVRSVLTPSEGVRVVVDRDLAHGPEPGDLAGLRLLPRPDGTWEGAPSVYPLSEEVRRLVMADIARLADRESEAAITAWLIDVLSPG